MAFNIYKAVDANTGVWSFDNGQPRVEPLGDGGKEEMLHLLPPVEKAASKSSVLDKS